MPGPQAPDEAHREHLRCAARGPDEWREAIRIDRVRHYMDTLGRTGPQRDPSGQDTGDRDEPRGSREYTIRQLLGAVAIHQPPMRRRLLDQRRIDLQEPGGAGVARVLHAGEAP